MQNIFEDTCKLLKYSLSARNGHTVKLKTNIYFFFSAFNIFSRIWNFNKTWLTRLNFSSFFNQFIRALPNNDITYIDETAKPKLITDQHL